MAADENSEEFEKKLAKLRRLASEEKVSFVKIAKCLVEVVGMYQLKVDELYEETFDLLELLTKRSSEIAGQSVKEPRMKTPKKVTPKMPRRKRKIIIVDAPKRESFDVVELNRSTSSIDLPPKKKSHLMLAKKHSSSTEEAPPIDLTLFDWLEEQDEQVGQKYSFKINSQLMKSVDLNSTVNLSAADLEFENDLEKSLTCLDISGFLSLGEENQNDISSVHDEKEMDQVLTSFSEDFPSSSNEVAEGQFASENVETDFAQSQISGKTVEPRPKEMKKKKAKRTDENGNNVIVSKEARHQGQKKTKKKLGIKRKCKLQKSSTKKKRLITFDPIEELRRQEARELREQQAAERQKRLIDLDNQPLPEEHQLQEVQTELDHQVLDETPPLCESILEHDSPIVSHSNKRRSFPNKSIFKVDQYSHEILSWFKINEETNLDFSKTITFHPKWTYKKSDICRLFLSTLHLVNEGKVSIQPIMEEDNFFIHSESM